MDSQLEEELLRRAQGGCRESFDRLIDHHRGRLEEAIDRRMSLRLRSKVEPRDIFQETCLRAWSSLGRFERRGPDSFVQWIVSIASNVIVSAARHYFSTGRRLEGAFPDGAFEESGPQGPDLLQDEKAISPGRNAVRHERFERLKAALRQLSEEQQQVIVLAKIDRLPVAEIARQTGRTESATSMLLLRALRRLKELLSDTGSLRLPPRNLQEELGAGGPADPGGKPS